MKASWSMDLVLRKTWWTFNGGNSEMQVCAKGECSVLEQQELESEQT